MPADFFDWHIRQPRLIENLPCGLGAGQPRLRWYIDVFVVGGTEFDLGVNAQNQPRDHQPHIISPNKSKYHINRYLLVPPIICCFACLPLPVLQPSLTSPKVVVFQAIATLTLKHGKGSNHEGTPMDFSGMSYL